MSLLGGFSFPVALMQVHTEGIVFVLSSRLKSLCGRSPPKPCLLHLGSCPVFLHCEGTCHNKLLSTPVTPVPPTTVERNMSPSMASTPCELIPLHYPLFRYSYIGVVSGSGISLKINPISVAFLATEIGKISLLDQIDSLKVVLAVAWSQGQR